MQPNIAVGVSQLKEQLNRYDERDPQFESLHCLQDYLQVLLYFSAC